MHMLTIIAILATMNRTSDNEQNKRATQAAHKTKNKYTQPLRDRVK